MAEKGLSIQQKKEYAKLLYTKDTSISQKEIASKCDVSEKSIGKWIKEENWETLRDAMSLSRDEQIRSLNEQWNELNRAIKKKQPGKRYADSSEADILAKLSKAKSELETKVDVSKAVDFGKGLINYVRHVEFKDIELVARYYDGYLKSLM